MTRKSSGLRSDSSGAQADANTPAKVTIGTVSIKAIQGPAAQPVLKPPPVKVGGAPALRDVRDVRPQKSKSSAALGTTLGNASSSAAATGAAATGAGGVAGAGVARPSKPPEASPLSARPSSPASVITAQRTEATSAMGVTSTLPERQASQASSQAPSQASGAGAGPYQFVPPLPAQQPMPSVRGNGPKKWRRGLTHLKAWLSHVHVWVWLALGATLLGVTTLLTAWYMWPIRTVYVMGNNHLSVGEVRELAGLNGNFGWWYYGAWRAKGLQQSPWIVSAQLTREYPDKVIVQITERQPFLRWKKSNGEVVLVSKDGQILPNSTGYDELPVLTGWGPERLNEAMLVTLALSRYTVQSVEYTPSGITVKTAAGTVWSGDLKSLLKYAGSVSMYPKKQMNIYPWGVSVRQ